jgi:polygalacturonase
MDAVQSAGQDIMWRFTLRNSTNFHVDYKSCNGFTVWGLKIYSPQRARNTEGIEPGNSTNVTFARAFIDAGLPTMHMTISHNHFYSGPRDVDRQRDERRRERDPCHRPFA